MSGYKKKKKMRETKKRSTPLDLIRLRIVLGAIICVKLNLNTPGKGLLRLGVESVFFLGEGAIRVYKSVR